MRTPRVLLLFVLLALLALSAVAQDNSNTDNKDDAKTTTAETRTTADDSKTTSKADTKTDTKADVPSLTTKKDSTSTTAKAATTTSKKTTEATTASTAESTSQDSDLPSVSSKTSAMPKITLGYEIPTVTPPPIKNAPFMQRSSLPEGTVFIGVGAALGFFALVIMAWRGLVAWSLHRSVKRAAHASAYADTKAMLQPPHRRAGKPSHSNNSPGGGGFYAAGPGSTLSLDHITSSGRSPAPPATNSSLFFSPTSNAGSGGERRSAYLPAGFYASGAPGNRNSTAPSNNSQTQFHAHSQSASSRGGLVAGRSPPASPLMDPTGSRGNAGANTERLSGIRVNDSATSLNLPPTGRAPSAYLEDLFESHRQAPGSGGHGARY